MKSYPPLPPSGTSCGTKLRHKKRLPFFGRSYISLWRLMSAAGKCRLRSTKVSLVTARSRWNWWNIGFLAIHSLNKGGDVLPISCGNSLPKRGTLAQGNLFVWCNAFLTNLCARHWSGFSWGVVFHGSFGANKMICCLMRCNGPLNFEEIQHLQNWSYPVQSTTLIIPISECGTNSWITHYFAKAQNWWELKFLLSVTKFMNRCSFTINVF